MRWCFSSSGLMVARSLSDVFRSEDSFEDGCDALVRRGLWVQREDDTFFGTKMNAPSFDAVKTSGSPSPVTSIAVLTPDHSTIDPVAIRRRFA